jgi:FtsP/CotA-like multicopper oxidase with cupredoxin domain
MSENPPRRMSRRGALRLAGTCAVAAALPIGRAHAQAQPRILTAAPAQVRMVGDQYPATKVWTYDGDIPGPALRFRQGERLRIDLRNGLEAPTTVHWHGIRLPNAMDGVPHRRRSRS